MCQEFCSQGGSALRGVCSRGAGPGGCLLQGVSARGGDMSARGCLLQGGVCSWGAWWRPPRTATAVGGTHPTGMHSCETFFLSATFDHLLKIKKTSRYDFLFSARSDDE